MWIWICPLMLTQKQTRLDLVNAHGTSIEIFARQCARILGLTVAATARRRRHHSCCRCGKWLHLHVQLLHTHTHAHAVADWKLRTLCISHLLMHGLLTNWGAFTMLCSSGFIHTSHSRLPSSRPTAAAGNGGPSAAVACCVAHFPAALSRT